MVTPLLIQSCAKQLILCIFLFFQDQYRFCYRIIKEYHKIVTQVRGQKGSKSTPATNEMDDNCNAANNNNGNRNSNLCQEDGNSYDERKNFLSNSVTEYQPELNLRENTIVSKVGHHGSVLMTYADTTHARKSSFQPGNSVSQGTIFIPGHGQNFETSTGSSSQAKQSSQSTVGLSSQSKSVRFQEQHVYSTTSAGIPHSNKLAEEVPPVLSNSKWENRVGLYMFPDSWGPFQYRMPHDRYGKSHCGDKIIMSSYLHNGITRLERQHIYLEMARNHFSMIFFF